MVVFLNRFKTFWFLKGGCLIQIIYDRIKIAWEKFFVNITFNR